jgi:hypothetical protein
MVSKTMGQVVNGLEKALETNNLEQVRLTWMLSVF